MPLRVPYLLYCFYLHLPLILLPPFFFPLLICIECCLRFNFSTLDRSGTQHKTPQGLVLSLCFFFPLMCWITELNVVPVACQWVFRKELARPSADVLRVKSWTLPHGVTNEWKKIIINEPCMRTDPVWRTCTSCIIHLTQRITSVCLLRWSSTSCAAALAGSTSTTTTTKERCWA